MTSEARLAANRQNARKSTGPKTAQGKVRSSANALRHGLTARHFVAKGESAAEYRRLRKGVLAQFPPRNEIERNQIEHLIELFWKSRRAQLFETAALSVSPRVNNTVLNLVGTSCLTDLPLPEIYKRHLPVSDIFELTERLDRYTARIWREIHKLLDDIRSNRMLEIENVSEAPEENGDFNF